MKTQRAYLFLALALITVLLTSCRRSLAPDGGSPTDAAQATSQTSATETVAVDNQLYIFATQTAMAAQGMSTAVIPPADSTAELPVPTEGLPGGEATVAPPAALTQPPQVLPTQPAVIATAPPLVVPDTYTLQAGEFPFCIARRFDVDPGALLRANGLSSYSVYYSGMTLRIPKGSGAFPGNRSLMAHPTSYTVRAGDTINTIACAFGAVDPNAIAVVNNLTPPYRLTAGQVLQIP